MQFLWNCFRMELKPLNIFLFIKTSESQFPKKFFDVLTLKRLNWLSSSTDVETSCPERKTRNHEEGTCSKAMQDEETKGQL